MALNETTVESVERYRDVFLATRIDAALKGTSLIYEGEHRIEFLGFQAHKSQGKDKDSRDLNNHYRLYWRLQPQDGQAQDFKHFYVHHFALSNLAQGINKIAAFNPYAAKMIERFIKDNMKAFKRFCMKQISRMAAACSAIGRGTAGSITPPESGRSKRKKSLYVRQSGEDYKSEVDDDDV